jgi:hypothetical protein
MGIVTRLVLTCFVLAGSPAFGQTFGSIDGEARDASGAPVAGVAVSATNKNTNAVRNVITKRCGGIFLSFTGTGHLFAACREAWFQDGRPE